MLRLAIHCSVCRLRSNLDVRLFGASAWAYKLTGLLTNLASHSDRSWTRERSRQDHPLDSSEQRAEETAPPSMRQPQSSKEPALRRLSDSLSHHRREVALK